MGVRNLTRGKFVTLEGGEGAGKTTLSRSLASWLAEAGRPVLRTREPGGAPGAEAVRDLLLGQGPWDPVAEAMLHFAARREHLVRTIAPALEAGIWVVCDRFADSTWAYQGAGQGLARGVWEELADLTLGSLRPDVTLVLDLAPKVGLTRVSDRGRARAGMPPEGQQPPDRYERAGVDFHARVRAAFLAIAAAEPARCAVLDADQPAEMVSAAARRVVSERLGAP